MNESVITPSEFKELKGTLRKIGAFDALVDCDFDAYVMAAQLSYKDYVMEAVPWILRAVNGETVELTARRQAAIIAAVSEVNGLLYALCEGYDLTKAVYRLCVAVQAADNEAALRLITGADKAESEPETAGEAERAAGDEPAELERLRAMPTGFLCRELMAARETIREEKRIAADWRRIAEGNRAELEAKAAELAECRERLEKAVAEAEQWKKFCRDRLGTDAFPQVSEPQEIESDGGEAVEIFPEEDVKEIGDFL